MARQTPVGKGRTARATGEANNGADSRDDRRARREAAVLGCAAAALVAQGLGTDHGAFDLAAADELAEATPARSG